MRLDTLPGDILEHVVEYLDRNDLLRLFRVNRSFLMTLQQRVYRNLDCSTMALDVQRQIAQKLDQNDDLASAVQTIRIVPLLPPDPSTSDTHDTTQRLTLLRINGPTSQILKACSNVKQLELMTPNQREFEAAVTVESCTSHMRLDRLYLFNPLGDPIGLYMPLLRQQVTLTQLIIDPEIWDPEGLLLQPGELPALRSLSACAGLVRLLRVGRSILNWNLELSFRDIYVGLSRALQLLTEYGADASSQEPLGRLRITIPRVEHRVLGLILDHLIPCASKLERLELHCRDLGIDTLASIITHFRYLPELRVVFFGDALFSELVAGDYPRLWNKLKDVKATSPNLKIFSTMVFTDTFDGLVRGGIIPQPVKDGVLALFDGIILDDSQPLAVGETIFGHEFWASDIE